MLSSYVFGSGTENFLVKALFKVQKSMKVSYSVPTMSDYIHNRNPMKVKFYSFLHAMNIFYGEGRGRVASRRGL